MTLYNRLKTVNSTNPYFEKDLNKAKKANKFIGQGSPLSSTSKYMIAAGDLANTGSYCSQDVVFVSAEGLRKGRKCVDFDELKIAADANVIFVTDTIADRERPYNLGERQVAEFLKNNGYKDNGDGVWNK